MKIICAGMSKTGTKSLHAALEELGYTVYDLEENYFYFNDLYMRIKAKGWKKEDFQDMYQNVDATCDGPAYYFWENILEAFPDSKVILTIRENDSVWFESMERQILTMTKQYPGRFYSLVSSSWNRFWTFANDLAMLPFGVRDRTWYRTETHIAETVYKQAYRRHIAYVSHECPRHKLLVYHVKEGWKPLCDFLGHPVPEKPFPHLNKKSERTNDLKSSPLFDIARRDALKKCTFIALSRVLTVLMIKGWIKLPRKAISP